MYFSAKRWPEQFLQFPTHTFSENRAVYFYNITTINCLYLSSSMIASGKLIVILNMVFLPVCPQGKEKSRMKRGITIKPDTCTEHDLLWALRYCDFPSQREIAKLKCKYKQYGICLMYNHKSAKELFLTFFLKRTKLLLPQEDKANYLQDCRILVFCNILQNLFCVPNCMQKLQFEKDLFRGRQHF